MEEVNGEFFKIDICMNTNRIHQRNTNGWRKNLQALWFCNRDS